MSARVTRAPTSALHVGADAETATLIGLIASGTALLTLGATYALGVIGLVLPLAVVGLLACIRWPALPVGTLVFLVFVVDNVVGTGRGPLAEQLYDPNFGPSVFEMLLYLSISCVAFDAARRRRLPPIPWEVGAALALLAVALVIGSIVGYSEGSGIKEQVTGWRRVIPVVVVVPLVAAVLPRDRLRVVLAVAAVLVIVKAAAALVLTAQSGGGTAGIILYEGTGNWLFLTYILIVLAAWAGRAPLPWWMWAALPIVSAAFVVGLKRSLWLGGLVGVAMVLAIGLSRLGRRVVMAAVVVSGVAVWLLLASGFSVALDGPVTDRVSSLNPRSLAANPQDRYRLDERANVVAALREKPLTGLGEGIPWPAVYPVGLEHDDARNYVHFALLWFWMKYSVLGAIGYAALMLAATMVGVRVARRATDPLIAAAGLGIGAAVVSLACAELTVTWIGADQRFTLLLGASIGVLCVMDRGRAERQRRSGSAGVAVEGPV